MLRERLIALGLSNRESEVAAVVAKGVTNREAAAGLFVTEKTVKFHLTNIYRKMNINSRSQLIVWCAAYLRYDPSLRAPDDIPLIHNEANLPSGEA